MERQNSKWRHRWQNLIKDPWRKLIALILGIMCWLALRSTASRDGNQRWTTIENVPVTISSASNTGKMGYYIPEGQLEPSTVSLDIAIDFWQRNATVRADQFRIVIDPQNLTGSDDHSRTVPLRSRYQLRADDLRQKPEGVRVRRMSPSEVYVTWDRYVSREFPVVVDVDNQLPPNLEPEIRNHTPKVTVFGPAFKVNQISTIRTSRIYLREASQEPYDLTLKLQPPGVPGVTLSTESVKVTVNIINQQDTVTKKLTNVRLDYLTRADSNLKLAPNDAIRRDVDVLVYGPISAIKELKAEDVIALCDLTGYSVPGYQDVEVQILRLPPQVHVQEVIPGGRQRVKLVSVSESAN